MRTLRFYITNVIFQILDLYAPSSLGPGPCRNFSLCLLKTLGITPLLIQSSSLRVILIRKFFVYQLFSHCPAIFTCRIDFSWYRSSTGTFFFAFKTYSSVFIAQRNSRCVTQATAHMILSTLWQRHFSKVFSLFLGDFIKVHVSENTEKYLVRLSTWLLTAVSRWVTYSNLLIDRKMTRRNICIGKSENETK